MLHVSSKYMCVFFSNLLQMMCEMRYYYRHIICRNETVLGIWYGPIQIPISLKDNSVNFEPTSFIILTSLAFCTQWFQVTLPYKFKLKFYHSEICIMKIIHLLYSVLYISIYIFFSKGLNSIVFFLNKRFIYLIVTIFT